MFEHLHDGGEAAHLPRVAHRVTVLIVDTHIVEVTLRGKLMRLQAHTENTRKLGMYNT